MKKLIVSALLTFAYCFGYSQSSDSKIVKFHSKMGEIQHVSNRDNVKKVTDSYLLIFDFGNKTVTVEPDQFKLDMVKMLEEYESEKHITTTILCVDANYKKYKVSLSQIKMAKKAIVNITFDDLDYIYFIED